MRLTKVTHVDLSVTIIELIIGRHFARILNENIFLFKPEIRLPFLCVEGDGTIMYVKSTHNVHEYK